MWFRKCKFILENNNLKFVNDYFNKIKGTAMGTIFSPTYENLKLRFFELTIFAKINFGKTYEISSLKTGTILSIIVKLH